MTSTKSFDLIIVGSGPGGYVAAIRSSQLGLKTAIIERDQIGGRCLNYACIPAKAVLRAADVKDEVEHAAEFGITATAGKVDFARVAERRAEVISTLTGGVAGLMTKNKVEVIRGTASFNETGELVVEGDDAGVYSSDKIILACGSVRSGIPGLEYGERVIGTEEGWALNELPASMIVLGAGASGTEMASAYARLGCKVTLVEGTERVLPGEEKDVSKVVERGLKTQGIEVLTGNFATDIKPAAKSVSMMVGEAKIKAEIVVVAAGRHADTDVLGLSKVGIETDERGLVKVNDQLQTTRAGVWAIGDLVAGPALAHKASEEGILAAQSAAGQTVHAIDYRMIPRATFCTPNVASFGYTEEEAKAAGLDVASGKVPYGAVGAGTVYGDRTGFVKIVGDRKLKEIIGGHIVGVKATELIQEIVNAQALEGGYPELATIVHGHPTLSEAVSEAARAVDGWLIHG